MNLQWDRDFALEQAGGDEELLSELLDLLRNSVASDLARIKAALPAADYQALAAAAHSIRGAAANLGLKELRQVASELERAGLAKELAGVKERVDFLAELLGQLPSLR